MIVPTQSHLRSSVESFTCDLTPIRGYRDHSFRVYSSRGAYTNVNGMMQRLFSTFPNSAPGAGLLLLRFCAGGQLLLEGLRQIFDPASWTAQGLGFGELLTGSVLILGWLTPAASPCAALLVIGLALSDHRWELHTCQAAIALGLLALGPGAWSIDARLYGRRHIDV
jgi:putative oxidoreductase